MSRLVKIFTRDPQFSLSQDVIDEESADEGPSRVTRAEIHKQGETTKPTDEDYYRLESMNVEMDKRIGEQRSANYSRISSDSWPRRWLSGLVMWCIKITLWLFSYV